MIIKESVDVAAMLLERYDDIQKLGPNSRIYFVANIMELYHKVRESEGCRTEYGYEWTTDERKEQLKHEFKQYIKDAECLAEFIDGELERIVRLKEASAKKEQAYWDEQNAIINGEDEV